MAGNISKVVTDDGRVFRVGLTRPIKQGENYLHFRFASEIVFGVDTWLAEEDTPLPGLVLCEELVEKVSG